MKSIITLIFTVLLISNSNAQMPKHIKWTVAGKKTSSNTAEVYFKAVLDPTWHIWSQTPGDDMLIPPTWSFDGKSVKPIGKAKEIGKKQSKTEEGFKNKLHYYEGTVIFVQKIELKKMGDVSGSIEYQICDPKSCLPPADFKFTVKLK